MSDRRERDRRRRSRSRSPRERRERREKDSDRSDRDRDRDRRDRDRDRERDREPRERKERDREKDHKEDKNVENGETKNGAAAEVRNDQLDAISKQLEEETRLRRERVEEWRRTRERHDARIRQAQEEEEKEQKSNGNGQQQEGVLEEDVDDEEEPESEEEEEDAMEVDGIEEVTGEINGNIEDDEVDPLDAFMAELAQTDKKKDNKPSVRKVVIEKEDKEADAPHKGDIIDNEDDEPARVIEDFDIAEECKSLIARSKHLMETDHEKVYYKKFRKDFYREVPELSKMTKKEVDDFRKSLDSIKVRGKKAPKPIKNWAQCGVEKKVLNVLKKCNYEKPTPIQAQALPAILNGRDVIGIAKTGSGKTLAFLLPMFRHILDQEPLDEEDGPIAIIMTPTRELALQIYKEAFKFCKPLDLRVACIYGGVNISDQIRDLKQGAEIVVCTVGRMIDMLAANGGKVTNLRRVTYLVMDEADRMFDMGFEPQVMKIVKNIRPDRQTVLFSATFPKQMEALARKVLVEPVEIQVGGKSVVCSDVDQHALVVDEHVKLLKLLELLGQYYDYGSILVFVDKQEKADELVTELMAHGYNCAPLHGGIDQFDRDSTIVDFKTGKLKVMVATSVAARGLDVKKLILVINYDAPNHYEDYVHRVGRTGRAGNKGYAYTFLLPQGQERYAGEVCRAFENAGLEPPADVKELFTKWKEEQEAQGHKVILGGTGFSGTGYKYDEAESEQDMSKKMITKLVHGIEAGGEEDDESIEEQLFTLMKSKSRVVQREALENPFGFVSNDPSQPSTSTSTPGSSAPPVKLTKEQQRQQESKTATARAAAQRIAKEKLLGAIPVVEKDASATTVEAVLKGQSVPQIQLSAKAQAKQIAERLNSRLNYLPSAIHPSVNPDFHMNYFEEELEINDLPQQVRYKVCSRDSVAQVQEFADVGISVKGTHYPNGREPKEGQDRKLYLLLEARDELALKRAKEEIVRIMRDQIKQLSNQRQQVGGRYNVF